MLNWVHRLSSIRSPASRRARNAVDRQLRREVAAASVVPSPDLYRRTLAAVQDATREAPRDAFANPGLVRARPRALIAGYALACVTLVLLTAFAVVYTAGPAPEPSGGLGEQPALVNVSEMLQDLDVSWQDPLLNEARLIAADARKAQRHLMASLSIPTLKEPDPPGDL